MHPGATIAAILVGMIVFVGLMLALAVLILESEARKDGPYQDADWDGAGLKFHDDRNSRGEQQDHD
jgi:hypothetical protein